MGIDMLDGLKDRDAPLYTMGVAAKLVGTTAQTLRLYEKHGLILPSRERRNRLYTENDIKWFVEDRLETCHLLKAVGIEPVVFRQPWNQEPHDYLQVGSWQELQQRIAFP